MIRDRDSYSKYSRIIRYSNISIRIRIRILFFFFEIIRIRIRIRFEIFCKNIRIYSNIFVIRCIYSYSFRYSYSITSNRIYLFELLHEYEYL